MVLLKPGNVYPGSPGRLQHREGSAHPYSFVQKSGLLVELDTQPFASRELRHTQELYSANQLAKRDRWIGSDNMSNVWHPYSFGHIRGLTHMY